MTLSPAATWRLQSGITYLATSLTRLALKLEKRDAGNQRVYDMIQEARKLLPLFQQHTAAEFAGSGRPADTGFCSLPTDVQHAILRLASANKATARQLRSVCRAFAAHAWLTERLRTSLDTSGSADDLCCLPYLPRLVSITCSSCLPDEARERFVNSIVSRNLVAWPALTSLQFVGDEHPADFLGQLHLAPQLMQLDFRGLLPVAAKGACLLHGVWQLTQLRALSLTITLLYAASTPAFQHLSQLQLLTRLQYGLPVDGQGARVQLAFAKAVGSLPGLRELELRGWVCADDTDRAPWRTLMQRVGQLEHLTLLRFQDWLVTSTASAAHLPELASALQSLRALSHLELLGDAIYDGDGALDGAGFSGGCTLVAAIGVLTQLHTLEMSHLVGVNVRDCCKFLAPLTQLRRLALKQLPVFEPAAPAGALQAAALPVSQGDESSFLHLLSGMLRLQSLVLSGVSLSGRDALRVFSTGVSTLADLCTLDVGANGLALEPFMVLAQSCRHLPNLRVICGGMGAEKKIADFNTVAGDGVFSMGMRL